VCGYDQQSDDVLNIKKRSVSRTENCTASLFLRVQAHGATCVDIPSYGTYGTL